jgi:hypothetical protein
MEILEIRSSADFATSNELVLQSTGGSQFIPKIDIRKKSIHYFSKPQISEVPIATTGSKFKTPSSNFKTLFTE